jgi:3-isopropylmalate/(R)-2-methylmalate dehydratase small subunit
MEHGMHLKGKAHKFGNDINTDEIIPAKFLNTSDEKELGSHCMEGIEPGFVKRVKKGDIIVAGKNFGCGSSREHAPVSIKACGISCVVAKSFARIFYPKGSLVEIDLAKGVIKDTTKNKTYRAQSFPEFMQELIKAGGLLPWVKKNHTK